MKISATLKYLVLTSTLCTAGFGAFKFIDKHIANNKIENIITDFNPEIDEYKSIIHNEPEYFKAKYYQNVIDSLENIKKVKIK